MSETEGLPEGVNSDAPAADYPPPGSFDHRGLWCDECGDQTSHRRKGKSKLPWVCVRCIEAGRKRDSTEAEAVEGQELDQVLERAPAERADQIRRAREVTGQTSPPDPVTIKINQDGRTLTLPEDGVLSEEERRALRAYIDKAAALGPERVDAAAPIGALDEVEATVPHVSEDYYTLAGVPELDHEVRGRKYREERIDAIVQDAAQLVNSILLYIETWR